MTFLEAHQGDRVIIGSFISPPSVRWLGLFLFIVGLICLIGVSASFPFILSTIGFAAGVTLAVLGISLGLAAMFAFQITTHSTGDLNHHSKALMVIKRKQDANIKFMDFSTVPPTEIATAKISGEGKGHTITISSKGENQTIVTDDLKPGMEVKVGDAMLEALPNDSNGYSQFVLLDISKRAKVVFNDSNIIKKLQLSIQTGEVNTGVENSIDDINACIKSGQLNLGQKNIFKGRNSFWVESGELNLGSHNQMEQALIQVETGEVNTGNCNKTSRLELLNKTGSCNLGERNNLIGYRMINNKDYCLGSRNNVIIGNNSTGLISNSHGSVINSGVMINPCNIL